MKIAVIFHIVSAGLFLMMVPFAISAQETKKEVHIKITENGVVTKDTVYTTTDEISELEHFTEMEMDPSDMDKKHVKEKHVIVMSGDEKDEMTLEQECGDHKEVKVIVHNVDSHHHMPPVEEIWIGGPEDGRPCHTIIIHEGDCQDGHMEMDTAIIKDHMAQPPLPGNAGEQPVVVEKKVIKTDEGKKEIIIETKVVDETATKGKKKK